MTKSIDSGRRDSFKKVLLGGAALGSLSAFNFKEEKNSALKGNITHGVCAWCFRDYTLEELCVEVKKLGIKGIDLIGPDNWGILKKHKGMLCECRSEHVEANAEHIKIARKDMTMWRKVLME